MEVAPSALRAGYRLDRYELLCRIASGGMATVWLARLRGKRGFEKLFAIKTIRTELVDDPRFQEMLLDEARIASNIQHPNVAQILDLGEQQDVLFIVMERVDGDSLAKIRKLLAKLGAKLPVGIALRILADACAGLHAAHELRDDSGQPLGIVHRDVSPHNILVSSGGAVKVIDFGIAKAQNRQQGETRTGVVKGKVHYMAPEQVNKGRAVDRRADIWALGVCLHELVAGRVPDEADDDVEVIRKLLADEPPQLAEGLPDPILRILEQSLTLDADARFPTAAAMQLALEGAMKDLGEIATANGIAAFLRAELPELEERRRDLIARSIEEARDRGGTQVTTSGDDVAFAPTVMRERGEASLSGEQPPPTRREGPALWVAPGPSPWTPAAVRVTPPEGPEQEPLEIPKHGRAWLWVLLLLFAAGGGLGYWRPVFATRVLNALGLGSRPSATEARPPAASTSQVTVAPASSQMALSAPSASAAAVAPSTGHASNPARSGSSHASGHPSSSASAASIGGLLDAGHPPSASASTPFVLLPPIASVPSPASPSAITLQPSAAPEPSEDEPSNPYRD
ncbi:MAG TPA: protein kinase [Polyangiaceae bacterium]|jgi:serine/threonine-protein kinase|nr:protein kinase [Polyangiaceae bacterium]